MAKVNNKNKKAAVTASHKKKNTKKTKPKTKSRAKGKTKKSTAKKKKLNIDSTPKTVLIFIICVIAVVGITAAAVSLASGGRHSGRVKTPDKDIAWGIDVSSHNGSVDWSAVKDGVDFVIGVIPRVKLIRISSIRIT